MTRHPMKARSIRVRDQLWQDAQEVADSRGELLSEVIRQAIQAYVFEHGKDAPNDATP